MDAANEEAFYQDQRDREDYNDQKYREELRIQAEERRLKEVAQVATPVTKAVEKTDKQETLTEENLRLKQIIKNFEQKQQMVEQSCYSDANLPAGQTCLTLRSGRKMPQGGFGLWKLPNDVCAQTVVDAVEAGYRCFDGAADYGNEKEVGEGIKRVLDAGTVKREDLFIVSKLWQTNHHPDRVEEALRKSLSDLQLDYVDMYIIHFPIALKYVAPEVRYPPQWTYDPKGENKMIIEKGVTYQMTYKAMEKCQLAGLTRDIGVSNLVFQTFAEIFQYCTIEPAVLQIELHPFCVQNALLRYVQESGTQMMAYSNLGGASYIQIGLAAEEHKPAETQLIKDIAKKYEKTGAQVCLRWAIQRQCVIVPKTQTKSRLPENIDVFNWTLTQDEMKAIDSLDKNLRFNDPIEYAEKFNGMYYPMYK